MTSQSWSSIVNSNYQAIVNQRRNDLQAARDVYSFIEASVGQPHDTKQEVTLEGDKVCLYWNTHEVCTLRVVRGEYILTPSSGGDKRVSGQPDALRFMGQLMAEAMDADLQEAKAAADAGPGAQRRGAA
jgi:hypothetical protein